MNSGQFGGSGLGTGIGTNTDAEEESQAIALTEISWERSMRNEENPRTREEVVRTATTISRTSAASPSSSPAAAAATTTMTTRQSNPLFSSSELSDEGGSGLGHEPSSSGAQANGTGTADTYKSPPKLNPIYSDGHGSEEHEQDLDHGKKSTVRFNSLAEDPLDDGLQTYADSSGKEEGDGANKTFSMRTKAHDFVYSVPVQALVVLMLITDVALLITEVFVDRGDTHSDDEKLRLHKAVDICTAIIVLLLMFEISLRIVADSPQVFMMKKLNIFDLVITVGSVVMVMIDLEYTGALLAGRSVRVASHLRMIQRARLATHSLRVITRSLGVSSSATMAARNKVGTNKKRFQRDGFDLDLCYITRNIIAMSVPAVDNIVKLYRNPIEDVERFFRKKHTELRADGKLHGLYQIHNMCPELPYSDSHFTISGGEIVRYGVQDHTPPSLNQLVDFCSSAQEFLQRKSMEPSTTDKGKNKLVLAIHCRGGKGRTGTAIVAWLLYSKQHKTNEEAMAYFARKRTDLKKKGKLQGIETPSQKRYCKCWEQYLQANWNWRNAKGMPPLGSLQHVPEPYIKLKSLSAPICLNVSRQLPDTFSQKQKEKAAAATLPTSLYVVVDTKNQDFLKVTMECPVNKDGSFTVDLTQDGGCTVRGDVRVRVFGLEADQRAPTIGEVSSSLLVTKAGKEHGLLFFFWFHSAFAVDTSTQSAGPSPLTLRLGDLDKAWKNKQGLFSPSTTVQLHVDNATTSVTQS